jgi:hypothetical protein
MIAIMTLLLVEMVACLENFVLRYNSKKKKTYKIIQIIIRSEINKESGKHLKKKLNFFL